MIISRTAPAVVCLLSLGLSSAQEISDVWQTTWNRTSLFQFQNQSPVPTFTSKVASAISNIVLNEAKVYQPVLGFGGTFTDSSAQLLAGLKTTNSTSYWSLLNYMFSPIEGANSAGLSYLRVPLGATDFSTEVYSYDEVDGDHCLNDLDVNSARPYIFEILKDIQSINNMLRPAWMKDSGTAFGGALQEEYLPMFAHYLLKLLEAFQSKGIKAYAISVQNEPMYETTTDPTTTYTPEIEGHVATLLKKLMIMKGFGDTKLIGFEQNWDQASGYATQLMKVAGGAFDGVAFHCAAGSVGQQDAFHAAFPEKEIYLTECSGTLGTDWWGDTKWYMDNIFIGSIEHNAQTAMMWNLALDASGNPMLPGATGCGTNGCRGIVTINGNGTWSVNQELAQASKGIIPRDIGGPSARRIGVAVQGTMSATLRVGAYVTYRTSSKDAPRYSLVVLNWNDSASSGWNPQPVTTTIEFRGKRATFTFPVGVTTLSWYAANITQLATREDDFLVDPMERDTHHRGHSIPSESGLKFLEFNPQRGCSALQ
ncbi:glycoside hydrolase [Ephemerocybe angulata]|uniref:Glycoside hydrolase n=1 Tax=Ephemerocybe angulata TaxID=980116 RepID=A0A8H6M2T2_9AGAR|nr:glycoside hydrolase [Tulosesus angulatus]